MATKLYDVVVVGAGPVGSRVADQLARRHLRVLALDRRPRPATDVCCTGVVGSACLELMEIPDRLVHHRPRGVVLVSPAGRRLSVERDDSVAAVVDRPALERFLVSRAEASGATFRFGATVSHLDVDRDEVTVGLLERGSRSVLAARSVVLATGHGPDLAPHFGLRRITDVWVGAQLEVSLLEHVPVTVFLDQDIAPGGFAWLVPTRAGVALAGIVARRLHDRRLSRLMSRLQRGYGVGGAIGPVGVRTIPLRPMPRTVSDRLLVVGAGAGQVKPTTGGGIYYGALCADIAATVLHDALRRDTLAAKDLVVYERTWRARLAHELGIGYLAHAALDRMDNRDLERLFSVAGRHDLGAWIRSLPAFSFDWHSRPLLDMITWLFASISVRGKRALAASDMRPGCRVS